MQRLQRGDTVVVISGQYKGKQGRIKKVLVDDDKVIIEGINLVKRHMRQRAQPAGRHHRERGAALGVQGDADRPEDQEGDPGEDQGRRERTEGARRQERRGDRGPALKARSLQF